MSVESKEIRCLFLFVLMTVELWNPLQKGSVNAVSCRGDLQGCERNKCAS